MSSAIQAAAEIIGFTLLIVLAGIVFTIEPGKTMLAVSVVSITILYGYIRLEGWLVEGDER